MTMNSEYLRTSNGVGPAVKAIVTMDRGIGDMDLITDTVLNWPAKGIATSGVPLPGSNEIDPDTACVFSYVLTGTIIHIEQFAPGYSDVGHSENEIVIVKPTSVWGDLVASFIDGVVGTIWYTGSGAPSTLHQEGDYYLNTSNGDVYRQVSGVWTVQFNMTGPTGPTGATGATGPQGATGPGVPTGGTTNQVLAKVSNTDNDTKWADVDAIPVGDDLSATLTTLTSHIPTTLGTGTSQNYRSPTDIEAKAIINALKMIAQQGGKRYANIDIAAATTVLNGYGFTVSQGYDSVSKRPYVLVAAEYTYPATAPYNSNYRAWGNYFFDLSRSVTQIIEAPHPQTDGNSESIALRNWQATPGALYIMSSVNRKAKDYMTNEIYTTNATGGTFTLSFRGQTTAAIAYNASIATIQAALEALSTIGSGNVVVTGDAPNTTLHAFANLSPSLYNAASPTDKITADGTSLTGTSPTISVDNDADQAHNYNSLFNKVAQSFATQGFAQLQLHGFSDVSSGVPRLFSAILSRGSSNNTKLIEVVRSALEANGFDVATKDSYSTQGLYVTGSPTGGSIVLQYNGINTTAIAYSTNQTTFAANVQAALEAHSSIGTGNVAVTQSQNDNTGVSQALVITFKGTLYHGGVGAITVATNSLTGGSTPTASGLTAEGTALTAQSNTQGDLAESNGTIFMHLEMSNTVRSDATLSARIVAALGSMNLGQLSAAAMPVLAEAGHTVSQSPLQNGSGATIGTSPVAARADHRHAMTNSAPNGGDYVRRNDANNAWTAVAVSQIKTDLALTKSDVGLGNVDNTSDATKNSAVATLSNKTLTAPVIATISNTGILTLPTSTDTLVGRTTTDTLTNKTLSAPVVTTSLTATDAPITAGTSTNILGTALSVLRNGSAVGRIDNNSSGLRVQAQAGALQLRGTGNSGISIDSSGNATGAGNITSTGGGIGYSTGAGGTVTQATSKSTGVTLNKLSGAITMNAAALAASTTVTFVLTNSFIAATDVLVMNHISGGTAGSYTLTAQAAAGSASITVRNVTAGSLSEAIVIQFAVIKAVTA